MPVGLKKWIEKPQPLQDESLSSWMVRTALANLNSLSSLLDYIRYYYLDLNIYDINKDYDLNWHSNLLEIFSSKTQVPIKILKKISSIKSNRNAKETLLESICQDCCTHDLNEKKRSLAIIKPQIDKCYFKEINATEEGKLITMSLFDFFTTQKTKKRKPLLVKSNFSLIPYISYRCGDNCKTNKPHNQQVLEWGGYQWIQKNPNITNQLWENYQIFDEEWYKYFFIGNLRDQRTSWLIINILRGKKNEDIQKEEGKILYKTGKIKSSGQTTLF